MPRRPRSEALLTARSSTEPCTCPFFTRSTRPVGFSRIRKSSALMKAMLVGWFKPVTTVRTPRFVTVIEGPLLCGATGTAALTVLFDGKGLCSLAVAVALVLSVPGAVGWIVKSIATDWPALMLPSVQPYRKPVWPTKSVQVPAPLLKVEPMFCGSVTSSIDAEAIAGPLFVTVYVKCRSSPACAGFGEMACATDTSASDAATTFRIGCAAWESGPLVALMLRALLPVGVALVVETVSVDDCGFASVMLTVAGWKFEDTPAGSPVTPSATWPVKPFSGVKVTL